MTEKVIVISNTAWSIHNFRRNLIRELQGARYSVIVIAPPDDYAGRIAETGARYIPLAMDNRGTNPWRDVQLCWALRRIFKRERPSCIVTFTIKPNLYGALAARFIGIPAVSNVSGLGTVFIKPTWITRVARFLYRAGLGAAAKVFFQNEDDRTYFVELGLVAKAKTALLPGSGVDTTLYQPMPAESSGGPFRFLLMGRLLWDKGVGEYVEAARMVRRRNPQSEFVLMGFTGVVNATAISTEQISRWEQEGTIIYLPATDKVRPEIAKAHCVVLPSYREGTPKSLLEAAAMGKPVITTDVPGCRQVVEDNRTGFLVRPRDARDLADKMERMINLTGAEREEMGRRGREKIVREFDERIVLETYLRTIGNLTGRGSPTNSWNLG